MRPAAAVVGLLLALALLVWPPSTPTAGQLLAPAAASLLRPARGTLWWVDRSCQIHQIRLPTGDRAVAGAGHCHVWPSPSGRLALASQDDPESPRPPGVLELLAGDGKRSLGVIGVRSDAISPAVSWAPDSSAVAFCATLGLQHAVEVLHLSAPIGSGAPGQRLSLAQPGRCQPAFDLNSGLATSDGRQVYLDNLTLPVGLLLARSAGGALPDVTVTAVAASPTGLVLGVVRRRRAGGAPTSLLVTVRRDGALNRVDPLPWPVQGITVSPDGFWVSVAHGTSGEESLISLGGTTRPAVIPPVTGGLAWSPDGRFLAAALPGELRIVDLRTGRSASLAGVEASSLAWTR